MKNILKIYLVGLVCLLPTLVFGQELTYEDIAKKDSEPSVIRIKDDINLNSKTIFQDHPKIFGLGEHDSMALVRSRKEHGCESFSYEYWQYHKGMRVENAYATVNEDNDRIYSIYSDIEKIISINIKPKISQKKAFKLAHKHLRAKKTYSLKKSETRRKRMKKDKLAIVTIQKEKESPPKYVLAYFFQIVARHPKQESFKLSFGDFQVCVDAHTGEIVRVQDVIAY